MALIILLMPPLIFAMLAAQSVGGLFLCLKRPSSGSPELVLFMGCMIGLLRTKWSELLLQSAFESRGGITQDVLLATSWEQGLWIIVYPLVVSVLTFELIRVIILKSVSSGSAPLLSSLRPLCLTAFYLASLTACMTIRFEFLNG